MNRPIDTTHMPPELRASFEVQRPSMTPAEIKSTAARALASAECVCRHWLPEGKRHGPEWIARNPTRDDHTSGSFSVNLITGQWSDFATDDKGGDLVSLVAYLGGSTQGEAARRLADVLGIDQANNRNSCDPAPAKRHPKVMATRPTWHPKLGAPSGTWDYLDATGEVLCVVMRFETATDKEFRPLTRTADGWIWKAPAEPRPLYGLDRLAARPDAPVILAEGEKAADAAGVLLPDHVHVASMNGAKSPGKSDWSPLAGRHVRIWPDHDDPGSQFAEAAARLAIAAGAASVEILNLADTFQEDPPPAGWDAADALDEGIGANWIAKHAVWGISIGPNKGGYTSDPSATGHQSIRDSSGTPPNSDRSLRGALTYADDEGNTKRLIDSQAADRVARHLSGKLARDPESGCWLIWIGTHWEPATSSAAADKLLADTVDEGCQPIGYRINYFTGVVLIIQKRGLLPPPVWPRDVIPFADKLLDIHSGRLDDPRPDRALDWCLPWRYDAKAQCPTIKAWLLRAVDGDQDTVELLRAWLAALLRGLMLQHFLTLIGRGGSGKGTFQRLVIALIGIRNVAVTDLARLEGNKFETARLYGKRLAMVNEAGRYGGSVDVLKAITGGDHVPLERKNVQQTGSFVFTGLVLMATNEPIVTTDSTSGLERRRITVRFPRSATAEEKAAWRARGGEEAVLHPEIPGLINWLLELSEDEIRRRIEAPPERVMRENLLGMAAGNSVGEWLMEYCKPVQNDTQGVQIGVRKEQRGFDGTTRYENADTRLYPNYLAWCDETGRNHPVSIRKFSETVLDIGETLGVEVRKERHPETRAATIYGLRLRLETEMPHDWAGSRRDRPEGSEVSGAVDGGDEPAPRRNRRDGGQKFGLYNSGGEVEGEL